MSHSNISITQELLEIQNLWPHLKSDGSEFAFKQDPEVIDIHVKFQGAQMQSGAHVAIAFKMTERVEQRICIKLCVKLRHSPAETIGMTQNVAAMGNW